MKDKVYVFDTTLRDGEQVPGCQLNTVEKIEIAKALEDLGVDIIEAGFPISSPGDFKSVVEISKAVSLSVICALTRAVKEDIVCAAEALKHAKRKRIHTGIGSSEQHIQFKLKTTRENILERATWATKYARNFVDDVEFYCEDAGRADLEFLAKMVELVIAAGATVVNIPDTTGYCLPDTYGKKIKYLMDHVPNIDKAVLSVHCHNDLGLATSNTISGLMNGARQMEVTINGIGERAGNTSLEEAAEKKCDLVLLPETIDFAWTHPNALKESQPILGPYSDIFCKHARDFGIYICVGLTEKAEGKLNYNSAILINDKGEIILKHRKINLLEVEFPYYEIGSKLEVVETPFGKIGLNICADNYIEATALGHSLARMGAQVILAPSSWTVDHHITEEDEPYRDKWIKPLGTLAKLYDMIVISATSVGYIVGGPYEGKKMVGCSLAMNKDGILKKGVFNEFAGVLEEVEFEIPVHKEKGTQIGDMLRKKGYRCDGE